MNTTLTTKQMALLREWGFFTMYKLERLPTKGVLITSKDPETLPIVIDEHGFSHVITTEQARKLQNP